MVARVNPKERKRPHFSFIIPVNLVFTVSATEETAKKFRELAKKNDDEISSIYKKQILEMLQSESPGINSIEEAFYEINELKEIRLKLKEKFGEYIKKGPGTKNEQIKKSHVFLSSVWENIHESYIDEHSKEEK